MNQHHQKTLLSEIITRLHWRTASTMLVMVKAHRGHPINKAADKTAKKRVTSDEYPNESFNTSYEEDLQVTLWPVQ